MVELLGRSMISSMLAIIFMLIARICISSPDACEQGDYSCEQGDPSTSLLQVDIGLENRQKQQHQGVHQYKESLIQVVQHSLAHALHMGDDENDESEPVDTSDEVDEDLQEQEDDDDQYPTVAPNADEDEEPGSVGFVGLKQKRKDALDHVEALHTIKDDGSYEEEPAPEPPAGDPPKESESLMQQNATGETDDKGVPSSMLGESLHSDRPSGPHLREVIETQDFLQKAKSFHDIVGGGGVYMISMHSRSERYIFSTQKFAKVGLHPSFFLATESSAPPAQLAEGCSMKAYESKVGRGGCSDQHLLHHAGGFVTEEMVQQKCDELDCAFYTWSKDEDSKHGAWFCMVDSYDTLDNAKQWPNWIAGRRLLKQQSRCDGRKKAGFGCVNTREQAIADSHRRALLAAQSRRDGGEWTAILEDDAVPVLEDERWTEQLIEVWKMIPPETDVVRLGWCGEHAPKHRWAANATSFVLADTPAGPRGDDPSWIGGCTHAYAVRRKAIPKMLGLFPCCCAVDCCYAFGMRRARINLLNIDSIGSQDWARDHGEYNQWEFGKAYGVIMQAKKELPSLRLEKR